MEKVRLIEEAVQNNKGVLSHDGALIVRTGPSTGRSTKERFVVKHPQNSADIEWGGVNQEMTPEKFEEFFTKTKNYLDK